MRVLLLGLLVSNCFTLDAGGSTRQPLAQATPTESKPSQPIELTLKPLGSTTAWKLSHERGNVVLLDVWATWCEPCRDALPLYDELNREFGGRGLKVYAISVDEDPSQIAKFLAELKVAVPVLLDPSAASAESTLHVKLMPTAFLIDRKGVIREVHEGFADDAKARYQAEIEALLAEP